ncbi:dihydrodipicolinate synthase family protein [Billgrantia pellis]|uniref:Dihydrodipicolinate synthase family protein n=1 Tax=Billgrantia pellis TaxID=2606936 RepID=A0A7V7G3E7_9GAMM|nr:dihydrodipicolinate synthase family protein [Halomonas pellis]KAA0013868.1 dihydrodipicolinate synthase family protein [Halomonas pellis]
MITTASRSRVEQALEGVSGVHVTPYLPNGRINDDLLRQVVNNIANAGVHNIVSGGNTGEFYSLTPDEITHAYQIAVDAAAGRSLITAGVGRSLHEAMKMAQAAEKAGVDAIMIHQPPDPFASPRMLVQYVRDISSVTGLPIIAYARNAGLTPSDFARLAEIESVVAIKYAVPDPLRMAECMRATQGSSMKWICGLAESWALPFYAYGARGFTSGLVNINAALSMRFHQALENSDWKQARQLVAAIADFEDMRTLEQNGTNVTVVKEAMRLVGQDVGFVRSPGVDRLNTPQVERLASILEEWKQQH